MPQSDDPSDGPYLSVDSANGNLRAPEDVDTLFECLADHRRRLLIEYLAENSGPVVVEEIVRYISEPDGGATHDTLSTDTLVEITVTLLHNHLPKMNDAGVVDVDHETSTVQEGDRFEIATALVAVV